VLIDTNVALDVLLKREPHFGPSAKVLLLSEKLQQRLYGSTD